MRLVISASPQSISINFDSLVFFYSLIIELKISGFPDYWTLKLDFFFLKKPAINFHMWLLTLRDQRNRWKLVGAVDIFLKTSTRKTHCRTLFLVFFNRQRHLYATSRVNNKKKYVKISNGNLSKDDPPYMLCLC